jgi:hypothetical protein
MTSKPILPIRLSQVDELDLADHMSLESGDRVYYLGEYTAQGGHEASDTNRLILDFKKATHRRGKPDWQEKETAIVKVAQLFKNAIPESLLTNATLVPTPPSKAKTDPAYDDRVLRMLHALAGGTILDIRELIVQTRSTVPFHSATVRPTIDALVANYEVDETQTSPDPKEVWLFDDTLITGKHFKACQRVVMARFPGVQVREFFIARRVPHKS